LPFAPRSLPAVTTTVSPFLTFTPPPPSGRSRREAQAPEPHGSLADARSRLQHLRCERDDLHEPLVPQFAPDRAEDAGTAGVAAVLDDDGRVLVEPDVRTVRAPPLLGRPDDDRLDDVALLDAGTRDGVLHR